MKVDPYTRKNSISYEFESIFKKYWIFVCLTDLLPRKGDFIIRLIAGEEIIIYNGVEGIVAFHNSCPHRQSPIFSEDHGNGPLVCPFHGWSFQDSGNIRAIPFAKSKYCFHEDDISKITLKRYHLHVVGKFIFINLSETPQSLESQISISIGQKLQEISDSMDDEVSIARIPVSTNWKLALEISLDPLHVPFVHKYTLLNIRGFDSSEIVKQIEDDSLSRDVTGESFLSEVDDPGASFMSPSFMVITKNPGIKKEVWHEYVSRYGIEDVYYDLYIFPNLHFVSADGGHSFSYEAYFPQEMSSTIVDYVFTTAKKIKSDRVFSVVHLESLRIGLAVFEEDIVMMEAVGRNVGDKPLVSLHGRWESNVVRWRKFFQEVDK